MKINTLQLKNIRSFKEAELTFVKSNFITGWNKDTQDKNGLGKSTIVLSLLLLLGGAKLVDINLKKFIRDGEKSASIKGVIEVGNDIIEVERILKVKGSGTLKFSINGEDPKLASSKIYQEKLLELIGSAENFKKFRIIDTSSGINILDFTSGQLRKTLMNMCQKKFDGLRKKLLDKKTQYEKYNKKLVISKHAPSNKRLEILESAIKTLDTTKLKEVMVKIQEFQMEKNKLLTEKGKLTQDKYIKEQQFNKFKAMAQCPTCLQKVTEEYKAPIFKDLSEKIKSLTEKTNSILTDLKMYDEIVSQEEKKRSKVYEEKQKINTLKSKLQTRLAQKEYIYSDKDVEIVKEALDVIDSFGNYYVMEWVKIIEPIVNSYIGQLNMQMTFTPDEKDNIEIIINRNDKTYTYDMLSQGEKIFISTIFKVALLMEKGESGLMIADEAFSCLSKENLDRILLSISELPVQLIFVTHILEETDLAKRIFIIKENGISILKEN